MYSKCTRYITDNIGKIVSGSEFNEYCDSQNSDFFKTILRNNMMNYSRNYQYKVGLNTSNDKLDKNGLTFSPTDKIWKYVDFGELLVDIKVPDNTNVFISSNYELKADDLIIENPTIWHENYKLCLEAIKDNGFALYYV
jgi:hypothetical protein